MGPQDYTNGYTVALHNRSRARGPMRSWPSTGTTAPSSPTETLARLVDNLAVPRRVLMMVKAGQPVDNVIDQLVPFLEAGGHRDRHQQLPLRGHPPPRGRPGREGPALRRGHGRVRRRGGGPERSGHHARRAEGVLRRARPPARGHLRPLRGRSLLYLDRHRRRRTLRQDGAQRHRVRGHAGYRQTYDLLRSIGGIEPADQAEIFRAWNGAPNWPATSSRSPPRSSATRTPRPASRSWTSWWTQPARREPAAGPLSPAWSWARRHRASRSRSSPAPCPRSRSSARWPRNAAGGKAAARPRELRRGRPPALYASKLVSYAQGLDMLTAAAAEYGWSLDLGTASPRCGVTAASSAPTCWTSS